MQQKGAFDVSKCWNDFDTPVIGRSAIKTNNLGCVFDQISLFSNENLFGYKYSICKC